MTDYRALITATVVAKIDPSTVVRDVSEAPMAEDERGFSGAALRRWRVQVIVDGRPRPLTLITKEAPLGERQVLAHLDAQRHRCLPFCHIADLTTDAAAPVCLRDVPGDPPPAPEDAIERAAAGLATIHAANFGQAGHLPWLPCADHDYFADQIVNRSWRVPWYQALKDAAFAREFGHLTPLLERAAERFVRAMDALTAEGHSLTLVHADMQPSGATRLTGHLTIHQGRPYFLDWGQARYGSFYLDLPNAFNARIALQHRDALDRLGHTIPVADFLERLHEAARYVGFKYLGYGLWRWKTGGTGESAHVLRHMLNLAIGGRDEASITLRLPADNKRDPPARDSFSRDEGPEAGDHQ